MAERAAQEGPESPGRSLSSSPEEGPPGGATADADDGHSELRSLVELVTGVLAEQLELPTYEEWLELYAADPAAVEDRLIGFWKDA